MTRALPFLPVLLGPALLLAGCGPLVQVGGNTPRPESLYTLSAPPPASVPAGLQPIDMTKAVTVDMPSVPGALQTMRIPVTVSDTSIQYVTGAQWSEQPNRLFQRLLADTLAARGVGVVDQRSSGQTGGRRLTGQLLAFGADVRSGQQVHVRYDAMLAGPDGVRQRRFEREVPLSSINGATVTTALNQAANSVAADVAAWVSSAA
jgi:cholesterol transport system auxiliary component